MKTLFITFIMFIIFTTNAFAASEFSSSYDFTYEVLEGGLTKVTQQIGLTNLTTNYYASEYSLNFATEKIADISAHDSLGPLKAKISYQDGTTVIHVTFNEKVLGVGKTLKWQLTYSSAAIAQQEGRLWKINLPKIFKDDNPRNYNVKLIVPISFGQPSYLYPQPKTAFFWTKDEGAKNGIILTFGNWQTYQFNQVYNLKNPNFTPRIKEILLPATGDSQEIILEKINPRPFNINLDQGGNWLAGYFLWPRQNLKIRVQGYAKVFAYPFAIEGLTGQKEINFIPEIPADLEKNFSVGEETFWQKLWLTLLKR